MNSPQITPLARFVTLGEAVTTITQTQPGTWCSCIDGAAWNTARAMAQLGLPSAHAGMVSLDHFGQTLHATTRAHHLDLRYLQRHPNTSRVALLPDPASQQWSFVGQDTAELYFNPDVLPRGWWDAVEALHIAGISFLRPPLNNTLLTLAELAKKHQKAISFSPHPRGEVTQACRRAFRQWVLQVNIIQVSRQDLEAFLPDCFAEQALIQLRSWNPTIWVLYHDIEGITLSTPLHQVSLREDFAKKPARSQEFCVAALHFSLINHPGWSASEHLLWVLDVEETRRFAPQGT